MGKEVIGTNKWGHFLEKLWENGRASGPKVAVFNKGKVPTI